MPPRRLAATPTILGLPRDQVHRMMSQGLNFRRVQAAVGWDYLSESPTTTVEAFCRLRTFTRQACEVQTVDTAHSVSAAEPLTNPECDYDIEQLNQ